MTSAYHAETLFLTASNVHSRVLETTEIQSWSALSALARSASVRISKNVFALKMAHSMTLKATSVSPAPQAAQRATHSTYARLAQRTITS